MDIVPVRVLRLLLWPERGRPVLRVALVVSVLSMGAAMGVAALEFALTLTISRATVILTISEELCCAVYLVARSRRYRRVFGRFQRAMGSLEGLDPGAREAVAQSERRATLFLRAWLAAGVALNVSYLLRPLSEATHAGEVQVGEVALLLGGDPLAAHFALQLLTSAGFITCGAYYILYDAVFVALSLHACCQFRVLAAALRRAEAPGQAGLWRCVAHHQELLSVLAELNALLSPMIFVMVVNNLFKMTIVTVDMVLTPVSDVNFGGILQLQMCTLVHVIIYCWGSAQVTWQSEAVLHAGYCCGWPEAGRSFKQALRLLMTRAARPAGFTIGGYGPLTLQTFLGMINFAYSVYAVLRQKYN